MFTDTISTLDFTKFAKQREPTQISCDYGILWMTVPESLLSLLWCVSTAHHAPLVCATVPQYDGRDELTNKENVIMLVKRCWIERQVLPASTTTKV